MSLLCCKKKQEKNKQANREGGSMVYDCDWASQHIIFDTWLSKKSAGCLTKTFFFKIYQQDRHFWHVSDMSPTFPTKWTTPTYTEETKATVSSVILLDTKADHTSHSDK